MHHRRRLRSFPTRLPLRKPALLCFNKEHYLEKLQAGEAVYKQKLAAQAKGIDRQDDKAIRDLKEQLLSVPGRFKLALAAALLSATPDLPGWHPLGFHHDDFCFDTVPRATVRALLGMERYDQEQAIETLDAMLPYDLPGLISALTVHHLRAAGKIETVSRETPAQTQEVT